MPIIKVPRRTLVITTTVLHDIHPLFILCKRTQDTLKHYSLKDIPSNSLPTLGQGRTGDKLLKQRPSVPCWPDWQDHDWPERVATIKKVFWAELSKVSYITESYCTFLQLVLHFGFIIEWIDLIVKIIYNGVLLWVIRMYKKSSMMIMQLWLQQYSKINIQFCVAHDKASIICRAKIIIWQLSPIMGWFATHQA